MDKFVIILSFVLLACLNINAQEYFFERIGTVEGENNLSARKIVQDDKGIIWIATFNGIYRYEGGEFIVKHHFIGDKSINPDVTCLLLDKSKNLWIGTDKGLSKYDLETEQLYKFEGDSARQEVVNDYRIRALALDSAGNVWIGTRDDGLKVYNSNTNDFLSVDFNLHSVVSPTHVKTIFIPNDSTVWLGTLYSGLYRLSVFGCEISGIDHFSFDEYSEFHRLNRVHTIFCDNKSQLVVGADYGLFVCETDTYSFREICPLNIPKGSQTNFYKKLLKDKQGNFWIGTYEGLLVSKSIDALELGDYSLFKHVHGINHSLSHNQVLDIFQDKSGVIWVGTENGINKFDPYQNQFHPITGKHVQGFIENSATVFMPYKEGVLILTLSDGVFYKHGNEICPFSRGLNNHEDLRNEKFYSMLVDSNKNIWLGTYNGMLVRLDSTGLLREKHKISKDFSPIYSIKEFKKGVLLLGTGSFHGGLMEFNIKKSQVSLVGDLTRNVEVNKIHIDCKGKIWLATQQGIFLKDVNGMTYEEFLPDDPKLVVSPNIFNDITESELGEIFIAGRNGLYRFVENENRFALVQLNTIPKFWVTNLQFDKKGMLWLNLNFNRIASWDPNSDEVILFSVSNGVRSMPVNHRGFCVDDNNVLYFSGFDQMFYCNTDKLEIDTYIPPPFFTELLINNTVVGAGEKINSQVVLDKHIAYQPDLVLNYKNRNFTLSFSNASYVVPRNNKYRYRLHGYDNEWIIGQVKSVRYIDLKPGKYVFEVYCTNSYGVWSEESLLLPITIKPTPFLSTWAFCIYLISFLLIANLINRVYIARVRLKRELIVEKVRREKDEAFHQERLRFYTNISHELRTPLTLIIGPVKRLIDKEKYNIEYIKMFELIYDNSKRLLTLVNQLLDFRKSLFEGIKLGVTNVNLLEVVESNLSAFEYMAKEKSLVVGFQNECNDIAQGWCDHEKLDSILFNIFSNAFKYTPSNGRIDVNLAIGRCLDSSEKCVIIKVKNSGKGIPKNLHEKVFERFYKIDDADDVYRGAGSGIGLSYVKMLVELHRGKITLESELGSFTCFTIALPIDRKSYRDLEVFDFERDADRSTKELLKGGMVISKENTDSLKPSKKGRLLLIEDNVELRGFLSDYLRDNFEIECAPDGVVGLEMCEKLLPDLVVSDVMMDNMSGFEFCSKLKTSSKISHIPVVLMTALTSAENILKGYKLGADDYISKPFEPELLRIRIQNLLENREKVKQQFLQSLHVSAKELTVSKIDEDFMNNLLKILDKYLKQEGLEVELICKEIGVSSSHLYRKIKGITGLSPIEFVNSYKMKRACQLLLETNMNISEISYEVGFGDPNYFSRIFKKYFNITPSRYRENPVHN